MAEIIVATIMRPTGDTGVQTHFQTFVQWLDRTGEKATIITPYNSPRWMVYPIFAVRRIIDRLYRPGSVWWYRYWHTYFLERSLRRRLANGGELIVYAQCPLSAAAARRARSSPNQKVVLVVHFNVSQADEWAGKGMIALEGSYAKAIRQFEADTINALDGLVFVSEFMRSAIVARIPSVSNIDYAVVPNFVADPGPVPATGEKAPDLLTIGTLEPRKNQAYAIQIIAAASKLGARLTLSIAGDGVDRESLKDLAVSLGVADQIQFFGMVAHAANLFAGHKACLHTAQIENFPLVLVEAMARGKPVFAPAVGGIPEAFSDGVEGRTIPLNDPVAAAQILIHWLVHNPDQLALAGVQARNTFLEKFQSDVAAANLNNYLTQVAYK